jgi:hypothetical protein
MIRILVSSVLCALLLGACEAGPKSDSSDHLLQAQKRALDKAKDADRLARDRAERLRKDLE